jgi:hypothetical protein
VPQVALGLPNPNRYGNTSQLPVGQLIDWVVQRHLAERAGEHYDVRLGTPNLGLLSWAVRKGLPAHGQKHLAIQQPVHSHSYKDFQGTIARGYGKGDVFTHDKGQALITRTSSNAVHFTVAHKGNPERFVLVKTGQGRDGKGWLLINLTPTEPLGAEKKRYVPVSPERAEALIKNLPDVSTQPKIDGAHAVMQILKDKLEVVSPRIAKTNRPILYTEKLFHGIPNPYDYNVPSNLRGTQMRGEVYASDPSGNIIHPGELGGLLNSTIANSIKKQQAKGLNLRTALFDIDKLGKKPVGDVPYLERYKMLESLLPHLPKNVHVIEQATNPDAAMGLWNKIREGKHGLSQEGIVIHRPIGNPYKAKLRNESDVWVREIFPGEGKYKGIGAGGYKYSLTPEGPIVGNVGTGLTDADRTDMWSNQQNYVGRVAKILSQEQFPSGAFRAPVHHSMHLDPRPVIPDVTAIDPIKTGATHDKEAAEKRSPNLLDLERDAATLSKSKISELSQLWGPRNQDLRPVEPIQEFLGRHGNETERNDFRKEGQQQGLLSRQLHLGNQVTASLEYSKKYENNLEWTNQMPSGMGKHYQHKLDDVAQTVDRFKMASRQSINTISRILHQTLSYPEWGNTLFNRMGRDIKTTSGNYQSAVKTGMDSRKSINGTCKEGQESIQPPIDPALLEQATEELNPTLPVQQQQLNRPGRHPLPTPAFADTPPAPPPDWIKHVMQTSFATYPPTGVFTRPAQEIADAGDQEGVAPKGLNSWLKMVNFHRNRGGKKLPQLQKDELTKAIQLLSQRIKERRQQPDMYDPKTLLPINI